MYKDNELYINPLFQDLEKKKDKYQLLYDFFSGKITTKSLLDRSEKNTRFLNIRINKQLLKLLELAVDYLKDLGCKINSRSDLIIQLIIAFLSKIMGKEEEADIERKLVIDPQIFVVYQGKKIKINDKKKESEIKNKIDLIKSLYHQLLDVHHAIQVQKKQGNKEVVKAIMMDRLQKRIDNISNQLFSVLTQEFIDQLYEMGKEPLAKKLQEIKQNALIIVEGLQAFT